jgi:hypothetical protein
LDQLAGHDRSAVYTNLDPGTYTFRVRGDNRDGVWDTEGTAFKLVVLPPWWRTWWAYALYVFAWSVECCSTSGYARQGL